MFYHLAVYTKHTQQKKITKHEHRKKNSDGNTPLSLSCMFTCANEGLPRQSVGDIMKISNSSIPSWSESSTISKSEVQRIIGLPIGASPTENIIWAGDATVTSAVDADVESTKKNHKT